MNKQNFLKRILTLTMFIPLLTSCSTTTPSEQREATLSPEPVATEQPTLESQPEHFGYAREGDFIYDISGGAYIVKYTGNAQVLTLPQTLGGHPVKGMYDTGEFSNNTSLISVTIPDNYTGELYETFNRCKALTTVKFGKGIKSVRTAFRECTSLENISVDQDNPYLSSKDGVLFNKDKTKLLLYPQAKRGKDYYIPNSVVRIGQAYTIPKSVVEIGDTAFSGCTTLTSVTINEGMKSIGAEAFVFCTSLESVTIPSSVTRMIEPFYESPNLTIYCKKGSYAHKYAKKYDLQFSLKQSAHR